jgi:tetratricopeptide (TPR) repeat protein
VALVCAAGGAAWWFGPSGAPYRYARTDLVSLWRTAQDHPNDVLAWKEIGLRLAQQGDPLAEQPLRRAYELAPNDPETATALGELLLSTKRISEAFQVLRRATETTPDFMPAHMALGRLYRRKASYHHAAEQYEQVVKRDRKNAAAWHELALCYIQVQQSAKAMEAVQAALAERPGDPALLALQGTIETVTGKADAGLDRLLDAARRAPDNAQVQSAALSGLLTYQRGPDDLRRAGEILDALEQKNPQSPRLMFQRGELERLEGKWTDAARQLEAARDAAPEIDDIYYSLARVYQRLGRQKDADQMLAVYRQRKALRSQIDDLRVDIGEHPDEARLHKKLASLLLQAADVHGAVEALQSAIQIDPGDKEARARLVSLSASAAPPESGL